MSSYAEQLATMNDIDEALKSAIAHSGAGEQRERWEQLRKELADERESLDRSAKRRAERDAQFKRYAAAFEPGLCSEGFGAGPTNEALDGTTVAEPAIGTAPNSHPDDGGPREIAFEKPAEE